MAFFEKAGNRAIRALFALNLSNEPLTVLLGLLPFILAKDLHASAWQISLLISLRPIMSLFSFYWSVFISKKPEWLKLSLIYSGISARLPFVGLLWWHSAGYVIFAAALHIFFSRGGLPAWMELLKRNVDKSRREKLFAVAGMLSYAEGIGVGFVVGSLLDWDSRYWRYFLVASSLLGLSGLWWQAAIPLSQNKGAIQYSSFSLRARRETFRFLNILVQPWKDSVTLIRTKPEFARFQLAFMCGGGGVMLITAVLPIFFANILHISHKEFSTARTLCMGIGFLVTSHWWGKAMSRFGLSLLTRLVVFCFVLFGISLTLSSYHIFWIYIAYVIYGVAQGGSHIVWHLSGPALSGEEDSSIYSGTNVVTVGLRGMVFPFLGSVLAMSFGPLPVIILGTIFCGLGALITRRSRPADLLSAGDQFLH
jgi:hypothetical protein